jgi:polyamine oxidase
MVKDANNRVKRGKPDSSVSIGLALAGWDSTNDMRKQAAEVLEWDLDAAAPPDLSSLIFGQLSDDASELLGPDERFVIDQRGFDIVTRHLASEYLKEGDQRLVLDSPVTRITYSNDSVTAHTANNTCYHGDYAICTFSLGVLQQAINSQALVQFQPAFPAWKKEAILGNIMGIYTKIFFQFDHDKVFWPRKVKNFYYASPTTRGYWLLWESLDFPGSPLEGSGIIFATMVWDQSRRIEQQSDEATKQEGLAVLRQMFPKATVPEPQAFLYPRWGTTSWAFGSYSNWAAGYTLKQHTNFRANLGRLWFAGEATSVEYFGYLHGAFYEGKSAAEEIAACVAGQTCIDRKQYADLQGEPERNYNSTSGFQNPISQVLGAY